MRDRVRELSVRQREHCLRDFLHLLPFRALLKQTQSILFENSRLGK